MCSTHTFKLCLKENRPKKVEKQGDFLAALYNIAPTNILEFENIFFSYLRFLNGKWNSFPIFMFFFHPLGKKKSSQSLIFFIAMKKMDFAPLGVYYSPRFARSIKANYFPREQSPALGNTSP